MSVDLDRSVPMRPRDGERDAEIEQLVTVVTDRVAARLIEAIEHDDGLRSDRRAAGAPLAADERRQQLMVGAWIGMEVTTVNEERLQRGLRSLTQPVEQRVRARVVAELTGAGPLEPYLSDPMVEEIDVNSADSTWVTYTDGRKIDVGALWASAAELTSFQKRMALRMTGTGEGRLDTSSPMLTLQSRDGARIVMVLGGTTEHGVSTHPRLAIRRFVVRQVGLTGLADLGLFPHPLVERLRALVRCGFTILVSGPPGAGKTTLLTELLGEVSPLERIITVEKNLLELRLEDDPRHPDAPALFTRHANAEGEGEITTRQLVELTRRLNPDRVVVGELVEDEAYVSRGYRPFGRRWTSLRQCRAIGADARQTDAGGPGAASTRRCSAGERIQAGVAAREAAVAAGRADADTAAVVAAGPAANTAASALAARDLIGQRGFSQEHYDSLTRSWASEIGPVHHDDAALMSSRS